MNNVDQSHKHREDVKRYVTRLKEIQKMISKDEKKDFIKTHCQKCKIKTEDVEPEIYTNKKLRKIRKSFCGICNERKCRFF